MQGDASAARRYLILTDEAEVEPAKVIVGNRYEVITLRQARNGLLQSMAGKQIVCWPSATNQAHEHMRSFALDILDDAKEVKFLDSTLPTGDWMTPSFMVNSKTPWDWDTFKAWATGESTGIVYLQVISKEHSEVAPQMNLETHGDKQETHRPADSHHQDDAEYAAKAPYIIQGSTHEPVTVSESGGESSPSQDDAQANPDGDPPAYPLARPPSPPESEFNADEETGLNGLIQKSSGLNSDPPQWAQEFAPPDQFRQLSASEAFNPYQEPKSDWPEPLDLTQQLYHAAPLDLSLIPASLRAIVGDFSHRTGIDPAPAFFGFLGAISGLANDFIRIQPKQNDNRWKVRPVVWLFAIGGSSSGKSPALEEGMTILQRKDQELILENTRKRKDYEHALKQYEDECAAARKNKAPRPPEPEAPKLREYWVSKGTTEGVTRVLEHSDKVTWYVDEASGLINSWDRYAAGGKGSGDREFVLQLWNGGPGKNTLAGRTISIPNASAVLCGGSTPVAMLKCAGGKLQNDGFLQRTLLCMVPKMKKGTDTAPDERAYQAYERILNNLLDMPGNATVKLSPEAQEVYNDFCATLNTRIEYEENESIAAQLGKWNGLAPRLMLIYYMIECADRGQFISDGNLVPADIARQVCSLLMDWQLSHISQFWNELMDEKIGRKFSQTISRFILSKPDLANLNFRDHVARPHWRDVEKLKPWELKDAINTLIAAAWIVPTTTRNNSHGVPGEYQINPRIRDMFSEEREREIEMRLVKREELQRMREKKRDREPGEDD
jgi:hypothetical protein